MAEGVGVKPLPAITWSDTSDREAALIAQCVAGDDAACSTLVTEHQRMVYQLAFHLLADRNEALDLSQEVFLQVFRTLPRFRGQSSLRTWIYRIVVNQARNRQRWWRRRHRSAQVSLDDHVKAHGELPSHGVFASPERVFGRKELASRLKTALLTMALCDTLSSARPLPTAQSLTEWSPLAVAANLPFGLKAAAPTIPVCPFSICTR